MMSTESVLNQIILTAIMIIVIYYVFYFMLKLRLPFTYRTKTYANLSLVLKYGGQFVANTLVAITATAISYHTIKTSFPNISDFKNEEVATLFIIMLGILIFGLNGRAILMFGRFLNHLCLYISLKKNNVSNNLKHAIANKNEQAIIENYKLIKQTDMKVNLSKEETIVLTACLSKHGLNEDVKQILIPILHKQDSFISNFIYKLRISTDYSIKGIDSTFKSSDTFKHKMKKYYSFSMNMNKIMIVAFVIQLLLILFSNILGIPNTFKVTFIFFVNFASIIAIIIKYKKIKEIYSNEVKNTNLSSANLQIKKSSTDNIMIIASVIMIVNTFIGLII